MIEFHNFHFKYPMRDKWALREVELKIRRGEFALIVGPSGCGKTTLIRTINGLIPHFYSGTIKGRVEVCGMDISSHSPAYLAGCVATVFQNPENQIVMNTVEREIAFPLENLGLSEDEISKRVEESLDVVGIAPLRRRKISELSGGEKQKVAIATSVGMHPDFLLLDEPTSQLSPNSAEDLLSLLERLNDELGLGILLVEHRLERVIHRVDRMIVLRNGEILEDGEPRLVLSRVNMDNLGVGYPQVTRIALKLHKKFLPLTVKEASKILEDTAKEFRLKKVEKKFGNRILHVSDLRFSYGKKPIIRGLSFTLKENEMLGIVGRNGSGKTTLAKLLTGILKPEKGRIVVTNSSMEKMKNMEKSRNVAMVFQNPNLHLFGDTIQEDVALGVKDERKVEEIMKTLGIWELREMNSRDLSGGERMLAAIASIAILEPRILILDEPTRGLCHGHKIRVTQFLKNYSRGHSVIVISHDMEFIARTTDTVALMADGKFIVHGDKRVVMGGSLNYTTQLNKVMSSIKDADKRILIEEDVEGLI